MISILRMKRGAVRVFGMIAIAVLVGSDTLQAGPVEAKVSAKVPVQMAAIIPIKDEINDVTFASMKRRVEKAREAGATIIVFEMDTPGGLVTSALDICNYIKNLTDHKTVAWVHPMAYSAGVMISLSCDEVVMSRSSRMGDCAPIIISPTDGLQTLGKTERAKAESPILKEFQDSANVGGYNRLLCEAMVRTGSEIWWLEDADDGERRFELTDKKDKLLSEEGGTWQLVETMTDPVTGREIEVKQPVVEERDLLTLTQSEAIAFGFAKAIISTEEELGDHYGITGEIARIIPNWSEWIADLLSSPIFRTILMMLIMMGIYAEFQSPGTFVGGAVALVALMIFLGAPYITGLADAWEILLVVLGVILLAVEFFIIPGFGVAGISGCMLILVGLIATFIPAEPGPIIIPRMPGSWLGLKTGLQVIFGGMVLALGGVWLLNRFLPHMPGARGLFLGSPGRWATSGVASSVASSSDFRPDTPATATEQIVRLGDVGKTATPLRPAGKAMINGRRVDVITRGQMMDEACSVEVIEVSGNHVVVRKIV